MGRAILIFICSLIFTLGPLSLTEGWAEKPPNEWETFVNHYRSLVVDGKEELARRMLDQRSADIEEYVQTLSERDQEIWSRLIQTDGKAMEESGVESALTFLEAVSSEDRVLFLKGKVNELTYLVKMSEPENFLVQWEIIRPTLSRFSDQQEIMFTEQMIHQYTIQNSEMTQNRLIEQLNLLVKEEEADAIIWTILTVGGSILLTLVYVGGKKYRARSIIRHRLKDGNS
ncbi:sporulation protein YpjB [Halobacillus litoralis]|uniref:sporulation protein YpjB n=1 Tax=Halobacillus litoralis TaxID=45668 RepID=UPI001CFD4159|nr:sporulation protein YpjB [Halobacillus litoralis]